MTDEAAKIAAGLSEAQKRALLSAQRFIEPLSPDHVRLKWKLLVYRDRGALAKSLQSLGCVRKDRVLTKKGLAVRAHLERLSDD